MQDGRRNRSLEICLLALLGQVLLAAGCASVAPGGAGMESGRVAARPEPRPLELELDGAQGFTVAEVVHVPGDVRLEYQRAISLLEREQLEPGIEALEEVIERAPEVVIPRIDLGVAYRRADDLEAAEGSLREALALAPDHPGALNELGIVLRRTGRFEEARASYQAALDVHPSFHFALLNLGVLCDLYLEDLHCALDSYRRYAAVVTDDPQVEMWIGDVENRLAATE